MPTCESSKVETMIAVVTHPAPGSAHHRAPPPQASCVGPLCPPCVWVPLPHCPFDLSWGLLPQTPSLTTILSSLSTIWKPIIYYWVHLCRQILFSTVSGRRGSCWGPVPSTGHGGAPMVGEGRNPLLNLVCSHVSHLAAPTKPTSSIRTSFPLSTFLFVSSCQISKQSGITRPKFEIFSPG